MCVLAKAQRELLLPPMGPGGMGDSQGQGTGGPYSPSLPGSHAFPTLGCRKSLGGVHLGYHSGVYHFCPVSFQESGPQGPCADPGPL